MAVADVDGDDNQDVYFVATSTVYTWGEDYSITSPSIVRMTDLTGDGTVNLLDFATFANWYGLETTQTVPDCVQ